ncbi:hypothetical protein NFI96_027964, partial [Prochilodus magdalenae]
MMLVLCGCVVYWRIYEPPREYLPLLLLSLCCSVLVLSPCDTLSSSGERDGFVGNVLVLLILGLYKNLKSLTNILILNLAVSDLIFTLSFWICYYIWSWTFGDFMCNSANCVVSVGFYSSTVFLMLMTIQRYVAVVHPQSVWNRWHSVLVLSPCDTLSSSGERDGLFGNVLVLLILGLYENLRSLTNIFILNLAVSDLIFTLGLPFWVCYYIWSWTFGDFMCQAVKFVPSVGFYSSTVFLMLMTIQRYVAAVHPQSVWNRWH